MQGATPSDAHAADPTVLEREGKPEPAGAETHVARISDPAQPQHPNNVSAALNLSIDGWSWSGMTSCMRRRHTAEERERLIAEVKATGEIPLVVAERMGVCASSAYRWVKEAGSAATVETPAFARVVPSRAAPRAGVIVQLGAGIDPCRGRLRCRAIASGRVGAW